MNFESNNSQKLKFVFVYILTFIPLFQFLENKFKKYFN